MNGSHMRVYFDYNATSPLSAAAADAVVGATRNVFGNASSVHHFGQQAKAALDEARSAVATLIRAEPSEIVFTSGGTESDNFAIRGVAALHEGIQPAGRRHLVATAIEHEAVLNTLKALSRHGWRTTLVPVDRSGVVSVDAVRDALADDTAIVSVMHANNEIGTIQPVAELGAICQQHGVTFHTDAVQWFGKEPFSSIHQFNADLVSVCAHKIHGPKGAGALFIKSPLHPDPLLLGGGHENERRAGTENLAGIFGLLEALKLFIKTPVFSRLHLSPLTDRLIQLIKSIENTQFVGSQTHRLANTVSFVTRGTDSIALLANLDLEGVCASSGSACSAGSLEPSHVIGALGIEGNLQNSLVRFSLGRDSTLEEVQSVEGILPEVISRTQKFQQPLE